ncbi:MAG: DNA repair ATPase [Planctomycetaceae bacterium]|nr:DNA repair ATPase [Planctomycetales bacterium]MCB9921913.1 DNA repair ATPase [Planctomycetaceae bacterium]
MSEPTPELTPNTERAVELEGGTYEIIRNRLISQGKEIRLRLAQLNDARREVFGAIETELIETARITTEHNCVPRDMVVIGGKLLFGYNVHFGLKTERNLKDVFSVYDFVDREFHQQALTLIEDERFVRDFAEVYRYYKQAVFAKFMNRGPHLYMVFRVGKSPTDIKSFKWAIAGDELHYLDNRSDHEVQYPPQHQFEWTRTTRDMHHFGMHPHISIEDRVFVETVGGDLTVKIENNTDSGEGIYAEPVDNPDQTLDDAEVQYAIIGNIILLKIRPYQEKAYRYIAYNEKTNRAERLDAIADACVLLPDDQGLIFSNGYYLQTGESKTFGNDLTQMMFERRITAPNGEDFLYTFYNRDTGTYILLPYHLIEQQVDTPVICNGFTVFESGELICFQTQDEAQKHHAIQIWQTPYVGENHVPATQTDSYLSKIGNRDIVRGMAECHGILTLIERQEVYASLYIDIVKETTDVLDSYFWLASDETFNLKEPLTAIKAAATSAIDEFEKVVRAKRNTAEQTKQTSTQVREVLGAIQHRRFAHINEFVESLASLRRVRGEIISLRDLRYVDGASVDQLETEVSEHTERLSHRCVEFLLLADSLRPYADHVAGQTAKIDELTKASEAKDLQEEIGKSAAELEMLIEIVSNLKIDDATQRTTIVDNISTIFGVVNQARASLKRKLKDLASVEGVAEFNSQLKLLNQGVVNYLDICDTPQKCEEYLTKVMIQLEELEGRFAEFDEFILQLTEKREEIYTAFENRRLALIEARNQRANTLMSAADRILKGIKNRVDSLETVSEINGYFAGDLMIEKIRDIVLQLEELEDSVKVGDIHSRLKTIREDAVRQLKDRDELYVDGKNVIQFGSHKFAVNVQQLDLTTVMRNERMMLHLTGTGFFEPIVNAELNDLSDVWRQDVVSENREVYRGEYLAHCIFHAALDARTVTDAESVMPVAWLARAEESELLDYVRRFMGPRYAEAYSKGVHDQDAARISQALAKMHTSIGLLRFQTRARTLARVYWSHFVDRKQKTLMAAKLQGCGVIGTLFPDTKQQAHYVRSLSTMLQAFVEESKLFELTLVEEAAEYLFHELTTGNDFVVSRVASELHDAFHSHLAQHSYAEKFAETLQKLKHDSAGSLVLARDWIAAFVASHSSDDSEEEWDYIDEVAALLAAGKLTRTRIVDGRITQELTDMAGSHPMIVDRRYHLHFNRFTSKLTQYARQVVPRFTRFVALKKEVVDAARDEMRLEEFRPRVLTSFVRNKLIDSVYLPLIGDNLAKQIGVVGEQKRTDLMGLLLLLSPPGYGKTTLMEYLANRLGVIFMKINGPALGHHITSLDPTEATNAAAREEVEKLNLALEMGDNVMIYVDDIQHCNPEFLQKFISLCDAQRKIEGVYKGHTRTYDLRGKTVAVVMAGNPYTESGEKFQIPDMLANRADVYNLGEIIGDSADVFEMSYLENSLTSNPILNKLASRSQADVYEVIRLARYDKHEDVNLEGNYSLEELNEMVAVMKKLMRVRDIILKVNREYIRSAAQSDDYRTEPPFKLQGSYRNMNRIAEKVVPIMNDQELQSLILSSYENDAQTLTSDQEANMLKFKELLGIITTTEANRWDDIKRTFAQNVKLRGVDAGSEVAQVLVQLGSLGDGLHSIKRALDDGIGRLTAPDGSAIEAKEQVAYVIEQLQALNNGMNSLGTALSNGVDQLSQQASSSKGLAAETLMPLLKHLQESAPAKEMSDDTRRIIVQYRLPKEVVGVLQHQFTLMQSWMLPILNAANLQSSDIQRLQESLNATLNSYATLVEHLEDLPPRPSKE